MLIYCVTGINNQHVYSRTKVPSRLLLEEIPKMSPLPALEFAYCELRTSTINKHNNCHILCRSRPLLLVGIFYSCHCNG